MSAKHIEIIARGLCVKDGKVLLCHSKGKWNTYLPGGHVEFREPARRSLEREIEEEMGLHAKVGKFLGAVEHTYKRNGRHQCEINLVFQFALPGLSTRRSPGSCEDYIEFFWVPVTALRRHHLEPSVLCGLIPSWLKSISVPSRWASTYGEQPA